MPSILELSRALVSLALVAIFLWQCHKAFDNLLSPTVVNKISESFEHKMVFPSITVCPLFTAEEQFRPPSEDIVKDYEAMDENELIAGVAMLEL